MYESGLCVYPPIHCLLRCVGVEGSRVSMTGVSARPDRRQRLFLRPACDQACETELMD